MCTRSAEPRGARRWATLALVCACACLDARPPPSAPAPCVPDVDAGVVCSRIHAPGISTPTSVDFHGALLRQTAYDPSSCRACHGETLRGGNSGVSCFGCHAAGPTGCATCHANIADRGAHRAHLGGRGVDTPEACAPCHVVPTGVASVGHVRLADGALDPAPAEVRFAPGLGPRAGVEPRYEPSAQRCRDVRCHGAALPDDGAADRAPTWTAGGPALGCGRCHGAPPTTPWHADTRCASCHPRVVVDEATLRDPTLHNDGRVDLGPGGSGACAECHAAIDAEPMHRAHLAPTLGLGGALDCAGCHLTPRTATAAGHLDSVGPVEVFPPGHRGVAWTRGSTPTWDRGAATCAGTWCHGPAVTLAWRRFPAQVRCGSCHAVPPDDAAHDVRWSAARCAECHPSVDRFGAPIVTQTATGAVSRHADGEIDLR